MYVLTHTSIICMDVYMEQGMLLCSYLMFAALLEWNFVVSISELKVLKTLCVDLTQFFPILFISQKHYV